MNFFFEVKKVGSLTIIAGLFTLKLPETLDQPIAQTIAEAEYMYIARNPKTHQTKCSNTKENPAYHESETSSQ